MGNFYPRPPRGGRQKLLHRAVKAIEFLSTPSARRATVRVRRGIAAVEDFYPRPPRGGRPCSCPRCPLWLRISIHALREEGDLARSPPFASVTEFLSTPSARRATHRRMTITTSYENFYPRPPRGGRRRHVGDGRALGAFLSTPSARRATLISSLSRSFSYRFLSTPSARRATEGALLVQGDAEISIHALREEGDFRFFREKTTLRKFLSTPSARRATRKIEQHERKRNISIHALREEGDATAALSPPRCRISIHALREEGDE